MKKEIYYSILAQMQNIESKKHILPKDTLGRTLAYNSLLPRLSDVQYLHENFRYTPCINTMPHKGLFVELKDLEIIMQDSIMQNNEPLALEQEILCIFIDDVKSPDKASLIDYIGILRRFMPVFVGYSGVIVDTYQILELAVAGADMCIFDYRFLQAQATIMLYIEEYLQDSHTFEIDVFFDFLEKNHREIMQKLPKITTMLINNFIVFSNEIGITPILALHSETDLAVLPMLQTPIDCFLVNPKLISLIPNSSLIFSLQDSHSTNPYQGIDVVLEYIVI